VFSSRCHLCGLHLLMLSLESQLLISILIQRLLLQGTLKQSFVLGTTSVIHATNFQS
jgi:hypothetical protein